ncbi:bacteriocin immunity protein [Pseudomonas chlororaphis]|uniref:Bacteriocin immunity protein n=1 Tax=Pseudomonas chlororaphis TaxID=587753 RepID=A0A1Q8ERS2_9PSED|nr:bacteriocin immunity protein [Pseudomonas chlororaphis]OLF54502.1 bacteriocin immunity protein [Pseudomonas chlororaphis]
MGNSISDYTEAEFIRFMQEVFTANGNGTPDEVLDDLLDKFRRLTGHPDGSDLIYWPEDEAQCTPEGITRTVKEWRSTHHLPGFKET